MKIKVNERKVALYVEYTKKFSEERKFRLFTNQKDDTGTGPFKARLNCVVISWFTRDPKKKITEEFEIQYRTITDSITYWKTTTDLRNYKLKTDTQNYKYDPFKTMVYLKGTYLDEDLINEFVACIEAIRKGEDITFELDNQKTMEN